MPGTFFEKRAFERKPAGEEVSISHGNMFYSGTILNISENGMFISTKKYFPLDTTSVIFIRKTNNHIKLFTKVKRITVSHEKGNGIGVELLTPPQAYLDFVNSLKPL